MRRRLSGTPAERFALRTIKGTAADACWEFDGFRDRQGYGHFRAGPGAKTYAHRFAWELSHGPISDGLCVLHRCDHPPCVNPAHLFLGDRADNNADMRAKGRASAAGQAKPGETKHAKLTAEQARDIRRRRAAGEKGRTLAREFGVHEGTICDIHKGRHWGHAT